MTEHPHPWTIRAFGIAAAAGILGWMVLLALFGWWWWQPVNLPDVTEPIPVLNPGKAVAINTPVILRMQVTKPEQLVAISSARFLECESGNLVTLTSNPVPLPIGTYTVVSDSIVIPAKVTAGDVCRAVIAVTFRINPIRDELVRFASEPFTVLPADNN